MLVSFDFDDTLAMTRPDENWGSVNCGPNEPMIAALRAHHEAGDEVIIVTSRHADGEFDCNRPKGWPPVVFVGVFVAEHKLPVTAIHFTDGENKVVTLERLGVVKHFDDDEEELALLPDHIEGVLAPIHPAWAQAIAAASSEDDNGGSQ